MTVLSDTPPVLPSRRFTVVEKLGEGGMGAVYEVADRERHERVALKALSRVSPEGVERFKNEFRSLQDLHHPNLVSLGELVEEEGHWFFTMELVRGCHFLQYVQQHGAPPQALSASPSNEARTLVQQERAPSAPTDEGSETANTLVLEGQSAAPGPASSPGPEPERQARSFDEARLRASLVQLARGLQVLHRASKVHRDIKPSNILVTESGRVVLLDFGVLSDVQELREQPGAVVGTPSYMAPEQAGGAPPSPEADWYSVGVLLYKSLTGALPFAGGAQEVMQVKGLMDPAPPQAHVDGLPEDLAALCMELLQRPPSRRPTGAQVLARLGGQAETAWTTVTLPFVGRRAELQVLQQALADSRQTRSVAVLVEGESGVGKSRLVRRFLDEADQQWPGALVLWGRCYERENVPYKGVDGLMEGLARHLARLDEATLRALEPEDSAALTQLFPVLQPALGRTSPRAEGARGDLLQVRVAAFLALRELLGRLAARAPVLLCLDDLQWADPDGLGLVDEVLTAPGILLVATVRTGTTWHGNASPTEEQEARFFREARKLPLQELPLAEAQDLVARLLGAEALQQPEQARRIAEESGGQPLFIDALVRHRRVSEGSDRPLQLEEALWVRAQHLDPGALQLLELLAVADGPLLQSVAARSTTINFTEYSRHVAALRSAHLALTSGPAGSDTVEVVHDRVRRAVAKHLDAATQRLWHLRLASTLEDLGQGEAETIARHLHGAGQVERAVGYYLQAACKAGEALAFAREAALYAQALELGEFEEVQRRRLLVARAEALANDGRAVLAAAVFLEAARGAPEAEAHVWRRRAAEQYMGHGHLQEGMALLRQALDEVGLSYPRSTLAAVASLLWVRLRLALRPLRPRSSEQVSPLVVQRLDTCWMVASSLASHSPLWGFCFYSRHLLMALDSGDLGRILRAYVLEIYFISIMSIRSRKRITKLLSHLMPLVTQAPQDAQTRVFLRMAHMAEPSCIGDLPPLREQMELLLPELRALRGEAWLKTSMYSLWSSSMGLSGELIELTRRLAGPVAEARERGDRYALTMFQMGAPPSLAMLARNEVAQARKLADELIALWPDDSRLMPSFLYALARSQIDLYEGRGEPVLERLAALLPHARSAMNATPSRCLVFHLRARARLLEAGKRQGREVGKLLSAAEADARCLEREGVKYALVMAALVRAGVKQVQGRREEALAAYGRAAEMAEAQGMRLHAEAARWREAELMGGEEGRTRLSALRQSMHERGLVVPEAMVAMMAPAPQAGHHL